jgi:hypothetical protein
MTVRADQPHRILWPERVAYSNGMLLDEADFQVEQSYHRGRLATLMRYLHGTGTVAGLNVEIDTVDDPMVVVAPGLGIDRVGRVIESPLPLCLRVDRWFEDRLADNPSALTESFRTGSGDTPDHVVADVFLGFRECEIAKRPSFSRGEFDALGAVAPLRLRDAVEATLVVRTEDDPPLPDVALPELSGSGAARRAALDEIKRTGGWVEDIWWSGLDGALAPDREHTEETNPADIFLARVLVPATAGNPPTFSPGVPPQADNAGRRMVYSTADLVALGG